MKIRDRKPEDSLRGNRPEKISPSAFFKSPPMLVCYSIFVLSSITYLVYSAQCMNPSSSSYNHLTLNIHNDHSDLEPEAPSADHQTNLSHVVFGIAGSAKLWSHRKNYIKQWWRSGEMRGAVWLDEPVNSTDDDHLLPPRRISGDTSGFEYSHPQGHRSGIRISRIVSESVRLDQPEVRWFVMGDDDTFFVPDNLINVLRKYDHNQFYYIGSSSESHVQNIHFSYNMAYGGGGFAISYPLAKALEKMQDSCIQRYPYLYGSDDRIQACMAELGVPLTREPGFHQCDFYGYLFGLLAAHPIAPLVSIHHLDIVDPIFPLMGRVEALQKLGPPMKLDSAGLMQQSICYDTSRGWTVSVSWGYAVQIFRGILLARDIEVPAITFLNWYKNIDKYGYAFNTRPYNRNVCQQPFIYYFDDVAFDSGMNRTVSGYNRQQAPSPDCDWKMADPATIGRVEVHKKPDPFLWTKAPRRQCCRILPTEEQGNMVIDVGACQEDEIIA